MGGGVPSSSLARSGGRSISFWLSWPFTTSGWPVLLTIQKGAKMERTMVPRLWNLLKNLSTDICTILLISLIFPGVIPGPS